MKHSCYSQQLQQDPRQDVASVGQVAKEIKITSGDCTQSNTKISHLLAIIARLAYLAHKTQGRTPRAQIGLLEPPRTTHYPTDIYVSEPQRLPIPDFPNIGRHCRIDATSSSRLS